MKNIWIFFTMILAGTFTLCGGSLLSPDLKNPLEELELYPEKMKQDYARCSKKLSEFEQKYSQGKLGAACAQLGDRFTLAKRLAASLQKTIGSKDAETLFFADRQIRDLKLFLQYFEEKEKAFAEQKTFPPPIVYSLKDFGAKGDGVTDDGPAFIAAFKKIAEAKGKPVRLEIPAGDYVLGKWYPCKMTRMPFGKKHNIVTGYQWQGLIVMKDLKNVTVTGEKGKTTLIQKSWDGMGLIVACCENVRWQNIIIRRDGPPFMQGTILKAFPKEKAILWKSDPGFILPDDPRTAGLINVSQSYDEKGNIVKGACQHFYKQKYVKVSADTFKLTLESFSGALRPGIKFILPVRKAPNGSVWTAMSKFCVYDNITIYDSRGAAFTDVTSFGNEYLNCRIIPNKKIGAQLSTNADGIHSQNNDFGMFVQNCEFRHLGDDAFNTYVKGRLLDKTLPNATVAGLGYEEGTFFSILSSDTGKVKASRTSLGADMEVEGRKKHSVTRFARPLPPNIVSHESLKQNKISANDLYHTQIGFIKPKLPDLVFAHGKSGVGTVIRDSIFEGMRNNQLVLQTSSALVENNVVDNCTYHGIFIAALVYPWQEGFHAFNVVIRNNKISRAPIGIGYAMNGHSHKDSHKVPAFYDIVIENNVINCPQPTRYINPLFREK